MTDTSSAKSPDDFDFNSNAPLPVDTFKHRAELAQLSSGTRHTSPKGTRTPPSSHPSPQHNHPQPQAPVVDAHGRVLNPRSCITCRRRKVKCDKLHPCSNCTRAHIECIFPGPGRAPRRPRKPAESKDNAELLARLRRLEGVVKGLGVDANGSSHDPVLKDHATDSNGSSPHTDQDHPPLFARSSTENSAHRRSSADTTSDPQRQLENRFGRLVVSEGRSRYVSTSFWASLSNEVEDIKGLLNEDSEDEDFGSPGTFEYPHGHAHHGWVFGHVPNSIELISLHPPAELIPVYLDLYKERLDPLVKILHLNSLSPAILASPSHLTNLSKGFEALLFAIYYGAVTSLRPEDCMAQLGEEKNTLLNKYRYGIENALVRAHFLTAEEMVISQAFVIYLICLRRNSDARVIWTLTGLLVRIAQKMGLHRDGTHFGLTPFVIEMRRRLWWQICVLDIRASEDYGCDPSVTEAQFDTRAPLNIHDSDIEPDSKEFPQERVGCTDMSLSLIRTEFASVLREIQYVAPNQSAEADPNSAATLANKERRIQEMQDKIEGKYLKDADMSVPFFWVTSTVARLMMSKAWIVLYHPFQRQDGNASLPEAIKEKLFLTCLENIEYAILLQTESRMMKWEWLFRTYMQWHALAFLLMTLCHRTRGPLVERAWVAIDKLKASTLSDAHNSNKKGAPWKPLHKLLVKAEAARVKAIQEDAERNINMEDTTGLTSRIMPGSVADYLRRSTSVSTVASPDSGGLDLSTFGGVSAKASTPQYSPLKLLDDSRTDSESIGLAQSNQLLNDMTTMESPSAFVDFSALDTPQVSSASFSNGSVGAFADSTNLLSFANNESSMQFSNTAVSTDSSQMPEQVAQQSFGVDPNNLSSTGMANMNLFGNLDTMNLSSDASWSEWNDLVKQFGADALEQDNMALGDDSGSLGSAGGSQQQQQHQQQTESFPPWNAAYGSFGVTPGNTNGMGGAMADWF